MWHPRRTQIFVGAGGRAGGGARILYDPDFSERGALVAVARAPRAKDASDLVPRLEPAYERPEKTGGGRKRQRDIVADRARVKHMPQGPAGTAGAGGRIGGGTGGTLLTQYLLKERGLLFNPTQEMDPREAVLRHSASSFLVDTACACTLLPVCVCVHVLTRTACLFPRVCAAQMRRRSRSASSRSRKRRRRKRSLAPSHREAGSK